MNYLVDTNIWLERMLDQERAAEVAEFLTRVPAHQLYLTDFSLHSIGVILHRLKQPRVFTQFVQDVLVEGFVHLLTVGPDQMGSLGEVAEKFSLDFDDAYQYVVASRYDLMIVTFDGDFDRTELGCRSPIEIIHMLDSEPDPEQES